MKIRNLAVLCTCILATTAGRAQTAPTQQDLETRLKSHFLMLRGMYDGDRLAFDSQGNLIGSAGNLPFSMSAMKVVRVELSDSALTLSGYHAGLEFSFNGAMVHSVPRGKVPLEVVIARDAQHEERLDAAVSKVFSIGIDEGLISTAPDYWRPWLHHHLHPHDPQDALPAGVQTLKRGFTPPRITDRPGPPHLPPGEGDPEHPAEVVLGCVVDTSGRLYDIHVVMPSGMGRDEAAAAALSQTRFMPATDRGTPVSVAMEMHFQYFLGQR